jgi:hypothetical protein
MFELKKKWYDFFVEFCQWFAKLIAWEIRNDPTIPSTKTKEEDPPPPPPRPPQNP